MHLRPVLAVTSLIFVAVIGGCSSADLVVAASEDAGEPGSDAAVDSAAPTDDSRADVVTPGIDAAGDGALDAMRDGLVPDSAVVVDAAGDVAVDAGDVAVDGAIDGLASDVIAVDGAETGCAVPLRCYFDRDGDGFVAAAGAFDGCVCPAGSRTISTTGSLFDCHDDDPAVHPGAGFHDGAYCVPGTSCSVKSFDYDCNGSEDKELGSGFGGCSSFGSGCTGAGWQGTTPACGAAQNFTTCSKGGLSCMQSTSSRVQRCR